MRISPKRDCEAEDETEMAPHGVEGHTPQTGKLTAVRRWKLLPLISPMEDLKNIIRHHLHRVYRIAQSKSRNEDDQITQKSTGYDMMNITLPSHGADSSTFISFSYSPISRP